MNVRSSVKMWTSHLSAEEMDLLIAGQAVEKRVPSSGEVEGTIVLMMDQEGRLHLTYIDGPA